ncbi:hypothetical protein [Paenibacillus sp. GCM10027626]|uniref:hypothetical protein n=1 Tax=Paenibacillus sp. GCM10027626 TaxID=3273411 RepID=UPI00363FC9B4
MNRKPFLTGLGIGVIIGALLLQLMNIGHEQMEQPERPGAEQSADKIYSQEELDQRVAEERKKLEEEQARKPVSPKAPNTPSKPEAVQPPRQQTETEEEAGSKPPAAPQTPEASVKPEKETAAEPASAVKPKKTAEPAAESPASPPPNTKEEADAAPRSQEPAADPEEERKKLEDLQSLKNLMRSTNARTGYLALEGAKAEREQKGKQPAGPPSAAEKSQDSAIKDKP